MRIITKVKVGKIRYTYIADDGEEMTEASALAQENAGTANIIDYAGSDLEKIKLSEEEIAWCDDELLKLDKEFLTAQRKGLSAQNIKDYAEAIENWANNSNFPDKSFRPEIQEL